ncbi:MAG TPA: hypothetical protein VHR66_26460 [Gemmataceae bacterium]|nr:hypothetical protein [Gemmataceae bacterium]
MPLPAYRGQVTYPIRQQGHCGFWVRLPPSQVRQSREPHQASAIADANPPNRPAPSPEGPRISRVDLPDIAQSIRDLYRAIEDPPRVPFSAPPWWPRVPRELNCTLPANGPPVHSWLIGCAMESLLYRLMGGNLHDRVDCPEIANSDLEQREKAKLLELREYLCGGGDGRFINARLANSASNAIQFKQYLFEVLSIVGEQPAVANDRSKAPAESSTDGTQAAANSPPRTVAVKDIGKNRPNNRPAIPLGPTFEPIRNWLVARFLNDTDAKTYKGLGDDPIVFERFGDFTSYLLSIGVDVLSSLEACRSAGWTEDLKIELFSAGEPSEAALPYLDTINRLDLPEGTHRLLGIRKGILNAAHIEPVADSEGDAQFATPERNRDNVPSLTPAEANALKAENLAKRLSEEEGIPLGNATDQEVFDWLNDHHSDDRVKPLLPASFGAFQQARVRGRKKQGTRKNPPPAATGKSVVRQSDLEPPSRPED